MRSYFIELRLFGAHARGGARSKWSQWSLAENRKAEGSCASDSKMEIFPWLSNIYRWRIYLWKVSYAFRKTAHLKHIKHAAFLSEPFVNYRLDLSLLIHRAVARGLPPPPPTHTHTHTHTHYILYNIQAWNQIACFFVVFMISQLYN